MAWKCNTCGMPNFDDDVCKLCGAPKPENPEEFVEETETATTATDSQEPVVAPVEEAEPAEVPAVEPAEEPESMDAPAEAPTEDAAPIEEAAEEPVEEPTKEPEAAAVPVEAPAEEPETTEVPAEEPAKDATPAEKTVASVTESAPKKSSKKGAIITVICVLILALLGAAAAYMHVTNKDTGKTTAMRSKENANDYRYFPDPDLPPIKLTDEEINNIKADIPLLPDARKNKYIDEFGLSAYQSEKIVSDIEMSNYFEEVAFNTKYRKIVANIIIGDIMRLNESEGFSCPIQPVNLAKLATLYGEQSINSSTVKKLIVRMWSEDFDPELVVEKENLKQINNREELSEIVKNILASNQKLVTDYNNGREQALKAIMGKAMGQTGGRANPVILEEILENKLKAE